MPPIEHVALETSEQGELTKRYVELWNDLESSAEPTDTEDKSRWFAVLSVAEDSTGLIPIDTLRISRTEAVMDKDDEVPFVYYDIRLMHANNEVFVLSYAPTAKRKDEIFTGGFSYEDSVGPDTLERVLERLEQLHAQGIIKPKTAEPEPAEMVPPSPEQAARIKLFQQWRSLVDELVVRFGVKKFNSVDIPALEIGKTVYNFGVQADTSEKVLILAEHRSDRVPELSNDWVEVYKTEDWELRLLPNGSYTLKVIHNIEAGKDGDFSNPLELYHVDYDESDELPGGVLELIKKGPRVITKLPDEAFRI